MPMYIEKVPNRNSKPAYLLRESRREGSKVIKTTLANLSHLPLEQIEAMREVLKGNTRLAGPEDVAVERTLPHGHAEAVLEVVRRTGLAEAIAPRPCRERDLVVGMVAERLLNPGSKLETARTWRSTTLGEELGIAEAGAEELYAALDWLLERQEGLERRLAKRRLGEGGLVLYDVSSSSYEGKRCPLAKWGYNRDGDGLPGIVYGLLTDGEGCPVAVRVYEGNTGDPKTVPDQVEKVKRGFGLEKVVLVGDRGMLTQAQVSKLKEYAGIGWITALRSNQIRELFAKGRIQRSLLDERDLAEIEAPEEFPGERLIVCFNPLLESERRRKRDVLLEATEQGLRRVAAEAARRTKTPLGKDRIGMKVGKVLGRHCMGKHFSVEIGEGSLRWSRKEESIRQEMDLDGIYVVRTSERGADLSAEDAVRGYKRLPQVERAFRSLKGLDLLVRPIYHRLPDRVRAHVLLCMLAYYVEWHLRGALAPLLFDDVERAAGRDGRDPVKPPEYSAEGKRKKARRQTEDGLPIHSLRSLLKELAACCRVVCRLKSAKGDILLTRLTERTPLQQRAHDLLAAMKRTQ